MINGNERALNGGLRYSLQGGSYEAYRDLFSWQVLPSVQEFQDAVEGAFNAWTVVDPISGLGTDLSFVAADDLIGDPTPLRNDDYGGRQFLYPFVQNDDYGDRQFLEPFVQVAIVPEPSSAFGLLVFGALGTGSVLKRKKKKASSL